VPEYLFRAADDTLLTKHLAMADVPSIGAEIRVDGKVYRRIPSFKVGTGTINRGNLYPYASDALPPTVEGCKFARSKSGRLKPIIESARHEREVAARHGYTKDGACWDEVEDPNR
jgi:hypothetical protein